MMQTETSIFEDDLRREEAADFEKRYRGDEAAQYKFTEAGLARFRHRFHDLEKRAKKRNLDGIFGYEVFRTFDEVIDEKTGEERTFHMVRVWGDSPKYRGWSFTGTLDFADGSDAIRRMVPGHKLPEQYYDFDPQMCEHCGTRRNRKEVFVLQHDDGSYKAVGRQCIKDFLGGKSPKQLAWFAEMVSDLSEAAEDREISSYGSYRVPTFYDPQEVIGLAAYSVRVNGWASSKSEGATRDHVGFLLNPQQIREDEQDRVRELAKVSKNDRARGASIYQWVLGQDTRDNDFLHNLQAVCKNAVSPRTLGIAVAAVIAYDMAVERETRRRERERSWQEKAAASDFVGEVGARIDVEGTVDMTRSWSTNWGLTTLVKWVDENDNIFIWKSSNCPDIAKGDKIAVRGTVKAHDVYRDAKQTQLTRCKLTVTESIHQEEE